MCYNAIQLKGRIVSDDKIPLFKRVVFLFLIERKKYDRYNRVI